MPSLMDLPDETLEQILILLADDDRLALYYDVIYVNKRINRIASPHVVRHAPIHCENPKHPPTPIHLLLHLFQHREQVKNVRTLFADSYEGDNSRLGEWKEYFNRLTDVQNFERIAEAAQESCPELASSSEWCHQLRNGGVDASVALLLSWCTRMVRLDYKMHRFVSDEIQSMTMRLIAISIRKIAVNINTSSREPLPLSQLEHVVLREPTSSSFSMQNMVHAAPFFYLPNLKFLATSRLGTDEPLRDISDDEPFRVESQAGRIALDPALYISRFPIGTSPIETLILDKTGFSATGFLVLVRACKRLKKLGIYIERHRPIPVDIHDPEGLNDLSEAIAYHSSSLEELTFRLLHDLAWEQYQKTRTPIPLYDCFKELSHLKRLTIHLEFLYRKIGPDDWVKITPDRWELEVELVPDRLPTNLEHLVLESERDVDKELIPKHIRHYQTLLAECGSDGRFNKLQSLAMPFEPRKWQFRSLFVAEGLEQFEALAESKGVQLIFGKDHFFVFPPMAPEPQPFLHGRFNFETDYRT
ncbi:hypothetical protein NW768_008013 [Fusarium equiseti]|uniref:F-box domain-containing protein n=1 Tax=Fusarium equiseti TaxID=61235 RepID=A0ABQ8R5J6_FUSEQ|nr:hypothetical protein NW768_008013 [Fusarium equiseti]